MSSHSHSETRASARSSQPAAPIHSKVQAAGAAGAASIVLVWVLSQLGVSMPAEVASALTTLVAAGAGWLRTAPSAA
jgi:hypothetical protein